MIPPTLLLRDSAALAVLAPVVGSAWGLSTAAALAAGAAAGWFNFALWAIAAHSVLGGTPIRAFIPVKLFAAIGLVALLGHFFPGVPALVGFGLPLLAILGRALFAQPTLSRAG
jgi:hypothetical protein